MYVKIKFSSVNKLLDERLNMQQRGVLITLLLCKEDDPKLHWLKFKSNVKYNKELKSILIELQDKKFIEWSGYYKAKEAMHDSEYMPVAKELIEYMNRVWNSRIRVNKSSTTNLIARLKEYSEDEIKLVISNRYEEWKDDPLMSKYLTPETVFRPSKFPKYLAQAEKTGKGEGRVESEKSNLKEDDILTEENTSGFSDRDLYNIKVCSLSPEGKVNKVGASIEKMTGKDIKRALKIQNNVKKRGMTPNFAYLCTKQT